MKMFRLKKTIDPFVPGIYKYENKFPNGDIIRVHLRVESDLNGILWINGNESFYLNESAALFSWCAITGISDADAVKIIRGHFGKEAAQAGKDYESFKPVITGLLNGQMSPCDLCQSGIDKTTPFSKMPDAPYRMDLALTYGCNNNCAHCYNEPGRAGTLLTLEKWRTILERLEKLGIPHIIFTGGEPTMVPFLPELVSYADQLGIVTGLNTNGRLLKNEDLAEDLARRSLDHVQITLESVHPEIHDAMVGAEGAWEETVAGIRNAVKHGIYVNTNTTLLTHNTSVEDVTALIDFLKETGVGTVGLNALIYSGKGKTVDSGIAPEKLSDVLEAAKEAVQRNGQRLLWYTPTQYCVFDPQNAGLGFKTCTAAKYSMCIEPDGNVLPCQSWYEPVGNILTDPWEKIWNAPLCIRLRNKEYMPQVCRGCESADVCSCGCPLEIENRLDVLKPRCGLPECF